MYIYISIILPLLLFPSWALAIAYYLCPCLFPFDYAHAMGRAHAPRPCAGPFEAPPTPLWTALATAPLQTAPQPPHMGGGHGRGIGKCKQA